MIKMPLLRYPEFTLLTLSIVEPYIFEGKTAKPLLRVDLRGNIYFISNVKE